MKAFITDWKACKYKWWEAILVAIYVFNPVMLVLILIVFVKSGRLNNKYLLSVELECFERLQLTWGNYWYVVGMIALQSRFSWHYRDLNPTLNMYKYLVRHRCLYCEHGEL
jgi:hypothetical protein